MKLSKLTAAQRALLVEAEGNAVAYVVDTYKPMLKLVDLGLATFERGRFDHGHVRITPAGREALNSQQAGNPDSEGASE